jgi:5-(carboxyamino)imidazole ribonucleotide synthase
MLKDISHIEKGFDSPSILEKLVDIEKEIAIIVAINEKGETATYPPVEMHFDPDLNLLDYQLCPANLNEKIISKAEVIALAAVRNFQSPGMFAVEMFIDKLGNAFVNEIAPRVHNSGHHTIEAHYCSQFDMLWRILLGVVPGNTEMILPSVMVNIIGAEGFSGAVKYEGVEEILKMKNTFLHLYGKNQTKPGRKMGHVTIMDPDKKELPARAEEVKRNLIAKA